MHFRKLLILALLVLFYAVGCNQPVFDGEQAYNLVATQLSFGPRIPGTVESENFQRFLLEELHDSGWDTEFQQFRFDDVKLSNIIAKNSQSPPTIILGTHYDTRALSDNDPNEDFRHTPVPGANDGSSGTAILMELANHLAKHDLSIWLVFFDAEDQGRIDGWEWSIGAQYFADNLKVSPGGVIIIDMVGDADLNIYLEKYSSPHISEEIWSVADRMGYADHFIPEERFAVIDDHLPFINKGIPTALIIDLDYAYWHTTEDDLVNISAGSLNIVGNVLLNYIESK